jgi:hypothetical protein
MDPNDRLAVIWALKPKLIFSAAEIYEDLGAIGSERRQMLGLE